MDIAAVMDEVAARLDTITGLRVTAFPIDKVNPPHAVVSLPEISYDLTYGRGSDRISLPVVIAVGRQSDRASRDKLLPFVAGTGPQSVKQVLEDDTEPYAAFDTLRVVSSDFDVLLWGTIEYLTAGFIIDITGSGSA